MPILGETWNEIFVFGADKQGSVMSVKMLSETEAWVAATYVIPSIYLYIYINVGCSKHIVPLITLRCVINFIIFLSYV